MNPLQEAEIARKLAKEREEAKPHVITDDNVIMAYGTTLASAWADFEEWLGETYNEICDEDPRDNLVALQCTERLAAQFDSEGYRELDPDKGWICRMGLAEVL